MKDLVTEIGVAVARNSAAITTDTTSAGNIIDTQGYESLTFVLEVDARTDGTFTPLIQEGDDSGLSDAAAVADEDLLPAGTGQEASAAISTANTVSKIGYRGRKRYVRLSIVSSSVTSGATVKALAIKGHPSKLPVS